VWIPAQKFEFSLLLPSQMLGELVTAGLGPAHVDSLYELCDRVRAAEQDKDPPPHAGLPVYIRTSTRT